MSDLDHPGVPCHCGSRTLGKGHILGQPLLPTPVRISSGYHFKPETVREEVHSVERCTIWRMVAEELKP